MTLDNLEYAIGHWAEERNLIDGSTSQAQCVKLGEEFGELCGGIAKGKQDVVVDSIGDMVVVLSIIALQNGTSLGECTQLAYDEIKHRKGRMVDGIFVKEEV